MNILVLYYYKTSTPIKVLDPAENLQTILNTFEDFRPSHNVVSFYLNTAQSCAAIQKYYGNRIA